MGKKCSVKNCPSGQIVDGIVENVSIFKLPPHEETRAKWLLFLQSYGSENVSSNVFVCEKHFANKDVRREYKCVDPDGNILLQHNFSKAKLVRGAVPILYSMIKENDITDRPVLKSVPSNYKSEINIDVANAQPVRESVDFKASIQHLENENDHEMTDDSVFLQIFNKAISLQLPDKSWGVHQIDSSVKIISVTQMKSASIDKDMPPFAVKQITIDENLNLKAYIHSKSFKIPRTNPQTVSDLESIIEDFHNMSVCSGGPSVTLYKSVILRCAYKDMFNKWRHNLCPLKTEGETTCKYCVRVFRAADANFCSLKKQRMPRLPLSPSTKTKIDVVRKAKRVQAQALHRNRVRLAHVKDELKTVLKKECSTESLNEVITKLNIPTNQVLLINECIKVGKYASKNSRRYTNERILLCLLLSIRSPAAYNFLRDNDILPLPAHSTMRKYLHMVDMKCGFDKKFLQALKKKVQSLPEIAKYGLLVFDEIQVRKSIAVNTKTMTFDGLVDNEQNDSEHNMNELADHALVFMFTSLGSDLRQTIGTFACKGATKGILLAQLVLQAIVVILFIKYSLLVNSGYIYIYRAGP